MYLRSEGVNPYQRQETSQHMRIQTTQDVLGRLKGFRHRAFSKVLKWAQTLSEVREDALAEIGLGYPLLRQMFHELGLRLVQSGALPDADDIFWLEKNEVEQFVVALDKGTSLESKQAIIEQRKAFWRKARQATPPPMLPARKKIMGMKTSLMLAESEDSQSGSTMQRCANQPRPSNCPSLPAAWRGGLRPHAPR